MVDISHVITSINQILDGSWTSKEVAVGKKIKFPIGVVSKGLMFQAAVRFKEVGWNVTRVVEISSDCDRMYYLNFINPRWSKP